MMNLIKFISIIIGLFFLPPMDNADFIANYSEEYLITLYPKESRGFLVCDCGDTGNYDYEELLTDTLPDIFGWTMHPTNCTEKLPVKVCNLLTTCRVCRGQMNGCTPYDGNYHACVLRKFEMRNDKDLWKDSDRHKRMVNDTGFTDGNYKKVNNTLVNATDFNGDLHKQFYDRVINDTDYTNGQDKKLYDNLIDDTHSNDEQYKNMVYRQSQDYHFSDGNYKEMFHGLLKDLHHNGDMYRKTFHRLLNDPNFNGDKYKEMSYKLLNNLYYSSEKYKKLFYRLSQDPELHDIYKNFFYRLMNNPYFNGEKYIEMFDRTLSDPNYNGEKYKKLFYRLLQNPFFNDNKYLEDYFRQMPANFKSGLPVHTISRRGTNGMVQTCPFPKAMETADLVVVFYPNSVMVQQYCKFGYTFPEGILREMRCNYTDDEWKPTYFFEECKPFLDCTVHLQATGKFYCTSGNSAEPPKCNITCERYEDYPKIEGVYECQIYGGWKPKLPHCAATKESLSLVPAPQVKLHAPQRS